MDVIIISEFCEDFSNTDNDRFFYLAKLLAEENQVEIVTSSFRHTTKKHRREPIERWSFTITFVEEPGYPKNICLRRFQSHRVWGKNVLKYIKNREKKPDAIYCAVPSLTGPNLVAKYCEKENIRFIIDVQDLWPEAFRMIFHVPVVSNLIFAPFTILANGIYKRADAICAVSDTYCQRAVSVNRKVKETTTVFLGTELATFDRYAARNPVLEKEDGEVWLAYCGTLGSSYNLICVIDALALLGDSAPRLIVMGDGPMMEEFQAHATKKEIDCVFTGRIPYDEMCAILSEVDIVVNPIKSRSAASIINKHADYAASGHPVLNTQESQEYRALVDEYHMGFNCINGDSDGLAIRIKELVDDYKLRVQMGENARRCAEEKFDRNKTYKIIEDILLAKGNAR